MVHDGVLVVGATNRPEALDAALLRPGRFDLAVHVPAPDAEARKAVLRVHLGKMPALDLGVCGAGREEAFEEAVTALAARTESFTGAEVEAACREAALAALKEHLSAATCAAAAPSTGGAGAGGEEATGRRRESAAGAEVVVRLRHLTAAIDAASPLLRDPLAAARFAGSFQGGVWKPGGVVP